MVGVRVLDREPDTDVEDDGDSDFDDVRVTVAETEMLAERDNDDVLDGDVDALLDIVDVREPVKEMVGVRVAVTDNVGVRLDVTDMVPDRDPDTLMEDVTEMLPESDGLEVELG
jgi:hypothetical protein